MPKTPMVAILSGSPDKSPAKPAPKKAPAKSGTKKVRVVELATTKFAMAKGKK